MHKLQPHPEHPLVVVDEQSNSLPSLASSDSLKALLTQLFQRASRCHAFEQGTVRFLSKQGLVVPLSYCEVLIAKIDRTIKKINQLIHQFSEISYLVWQLVTDKDREVVLEGLNEANHHLKFIMRNLFLIIETAKLTKDEPFYRVIAKDLRLRIDPKPRQIKKCVYIPPFVGIFSHAKRSNRSGFIELDPSRTKIIGKGGNGLVYSTTLEVNQQDYPVVLKVLQGGRATSEAVLIDCAHREAGVPLTIRHPFIISCLGVELSRREIHILLEKAEASLWDIIFFPKKNPEIARDLQQYFAFYLQDLLIALGFLHCNGFLHRDIKPDNIVFLRKEKQSDDEDADQRNFVIKILDFGTSESSKDRNPTPGTYEFLHPDTAKCVLKNSPYDHDPSLDLWALGITILTLFLGSNVFDSRRFGSIRNMLEYTSCLDQESIDQLISNALKGPFADLYLINMTTRTIVSMTLRALLSLDKKSQVTTHMLLETLEPFIRSLIKAQSEKQDSSISLCASSSDPY